MTARPTEQGFCHRVVAMGLGLCLVVLVPACTVVGPEYKEPVAETQSDWSGIETATLSSDPPLDPEWWKSAFNDPVLNALVETSLEQNLSLRSAALRVMQSQQQLAIALGNRYPQTQALSGAAQTSTTNLGTDEFYNLGFNLSWELDFWGRYSLAVRSASAQFDASVADYDGTMISLVANVAQSYLTIRTLEKRLQVAQYNLKLQQQNYEITLAKSTAGAVSELDVDQAEALVYNTTASVSSFEQSLQQTKNSLAILLGRVPQKMDVLLTDIQPIPASPANIALGMPQELIRRRPDIRTAERELAAQGAQIGIAVSELYPHFVIGGDIGTSAANNFSDLFSTGSYTLDLIGSFQWNIFNYGRLRSNIRYQDALFQQLLVDYRSTVLQAQGEVENSIVAYLKTQEQLAAYRVASDAAQRAADISATQYENGMVNFNTVISTLQSLQSQQDLLASTQGSVANNLVQVYKSLGGGWQVRGSKTADELLPESVRQEMLQRTKYWKKILE
jgi:NodT family efflux transporter outer membrane factor (OMF) lipoprotein